MGPRNRFQGMNSASLCILAGRYDNPLPPRFLAPIYSLKIPAQNCKQKQIQYMETIQRKQCYLCCYRQHWLGPVSYKGIMATFHTISCSCSFFSLKGRQRLLLYWLQRGRCGTHFNDVKASLLILRCAKKFRYKRVQK